MSLTKERQKEKKARDVICKALQEFQGSDSGIPEFAEERISSERYHEKLTSRGIEAGVIALILVNNMAGGSGEGISLFQLVQRYLLDIGFRTEVNHLMDRQ